MANKHRKHLNGSQSGKSNKLDPAPTEVAADGSSTEIGDEGGTGKRHKDKYFRAQTAMR